MYFNATWICRLAIAVPVIRPKVPVPNVAPGFENCGELKALKNSLRSINCWPSRQGSLNDLEAERSHVLVPGPTSGFLGEFPYCKTARTKAAVLNHIFGVWLEAVTLWPGTRFGLSHKPSLFSLSPL